MFNKLMTIPYKPGGRNSKGIDCYGLCILACKELGFVLPEFDGNSTVNFRNINGLVMRARNKFIKLEHPEPYCLVAFMIRKPYVSHVGILLEDGYHFLHIYSDAGVQINSVEELKWKDRIDGFYKWIK